MKFKKGMRVYHADSFVHATLIEKIDGLNGWRLLVDDGTKRAWWEKNLVLVSTTNEEGLAFLKKGDGL
jgi:hypothetical protein